jgi:hypothetical protein
MRIERCEKNKRTGLPVSSIGIDGEGWTQACPPEDGLLIVLDGQSKASGGAVVPATQLANYGYRDTAAFVARLMKMPKIWLQELANEVEADWTPKYNKKQLVEAILG